MDGLMMDGCTRMDTDCMKTYAAQPKKMTDQLYLYILFLNGVFIVLFSHSFSDDDLPRHFCL